MKTKKQNQTGSLHLAGILAVLVIAGVASIGVRVFNTSHAAGLELADGTSQTEAHKAYWTAKGDGKNFSDSKNWSDNILPKDGDWLMFEATPYLCKEGFGTNVYLTNDLKVHPRRVVYGFVRSGKVSDPGCTPPDGFQIGYGIDRLSFLGNAYVQKVPESIGDSQAYESYVGVSSQTFQSGLTLDGGNLYGTDNGGAPTTVTVPVTNLNLVNGAWVFSPQKGGGNFYPTYYQPSGLVHVGADSRFELSEKTTAKGIDQVSIDNGGMLYVAPQSSAIDLATLTVILGNEKSSTSRPLLYMPFYAVNGGKGHTLTFTADNFSLGNDVTVRVDQDAQYYPNRTLIIKGTSTKDGNKFKLEAGAGTFVDKTSPR